MGVQAGKGEIVSEAVSEAALDSRTETSGQRESAGHSIPTYLG